MIKKSDIDALISRLEEVLPTAFDPNIPENNQSPAIKVLNSILSAGMNYKRVIYPQLKKFEKNNPEIKSVTELADRISGYSAPIEFLKSEFNYRDRPRNRMKANAIADVTKYLCGIIEASPTVSEKEALKQWAIQAEPGDYRQLDIKGFKLASFQWLRMLFGADTTKPDVHINKFVRQTLNRKISRLDCICLIESAATCAKTTARAIDRAIWNMMQG